MMKHCDVVEVMNLAIQSELECGARVAKYMMLIRTLLDNQRGMADLERKLRCNRTRGA